MPQIDQHTELDDRIWQAGRSAGQGQVCEARKNNRNRFGVSGIECAVVEGVCRLSLEVDNLQSLGISSLLPDKLQGLSRKPRSSFQIKRIT